ncbi:MAG TPA: hypothetical protein VLE20_16490 [Blastocatellia bacterium]|nr:hypothetical protein [Blastocatellia bacterium]
MAAGFIAPPLVLDVAVGGFLWCFFFFVIVFIPVFPVAAAVAPDFFAVAFLFCANADVAAKAITITVDIRIFFIIVLREILSPSKARRSNRKSQPGKSADGKATVVPVLPIAN